MEFVHAPVLLDEVVEGLNIKASGIYADFTLGGAGHASAIALNLNNDGQLIGFDQDIDALNAARSTLTACACQIAFVNSNFRHAVDKLGDKYLGRIDGILMDLGVSSFQLDNPDRGFSYNQDCFLDMRMDQSGKKTAADIINKYTEGDIARVLYEYGEEKWAKRIAQFIVEERVVNPINTTFHLVKVIKAAVPVKCRQDSIHPAKRTFQALRIEVNEELKAVEEGIDAAVKLLSPSGRICIISFHSLEDRIVKTKFKEYSRKCICPDEKLICDCNHTPELKIITKKPVISSKEELENNPRARSAKLRVAEKL